MLPQARAKFLLGSPPLGPDGVWTALDPHATFRQHPTFELIELAVDAARAAANTHLDGVLARAEAIHSPSAEWVNQYPGEHYRLLAGFMSVLKPKLVVEIGTYTGVSALAFLAAAQPGCRVVTYDVIAWNDIPGSLLHQSDFDGDRLEQRIGDLAEPEYWSAQREVFVDADLVFLDGPKDDVFEAIILRRLAELPRPPGLLIVDDVRFLEMLAPWDAFPSPKLDVTSFGHWSGTGIALLGRRQENVGTGEVRAQR